ncbi:hexose kinase [Heyndrickxia acidiproducens]|uniref:hexose kinase n=1 Tax=Heyndrickxia acidiproducens TaxID=1121084 RepID=UPI000363EEA5|nr:hexose kinase [Heyndrickxia acidiproducens]
MLLAVTLNPSVDISYHLDRFRINEVNRVSKVKKTAGGKGLNVSRVAHLLGVKVLSTGVLGGSLGQYIEQQLDQDQMNHRFLHTKQEARNCIAVLHEGMQTEILESGPTLTNEDQEQFLALFNQLLDQVSVITISGSIVNGFSEDIYGKMIEHAIRKKIPVILDTSGKTLKVSLQNKNALPYLIKPNTDELGQLLGREISEDTESLKSALTDPLFYGIPWIVVSQGADGAFAKHGEDFYKVRIPKIKVENPVGSGDATVAGMAKAIDSKQDGVTMLKYGMTAGLLNTMQPQTGFVDASQFGTCLKLIEVQKV